MKSNKRIEAIDLFCGIGGLSYGLRQANIDVLAGLDSDKLCKYAYEQNNKCTFITADISEYDFNGMKDMYSKKSIRVLVGCAPCQPFSSHTYKKKGLQNDTRWNLINYFIKAMETIDPDVISMENVRGFTKTDVFDNFLHEIKSFGYQIDYGVINCSNYGVPQNRARLVLLGSKLGKVKIPPETHSKDDLVTVGQTIKHLPAINAGETSAQDALHRAKDLSSLNLQRIKQSKPKGSWKNWDSSLLPNCYKRKSGQTYTSVYGRMSWDDIAPTITTQFCNYGSGRFGHPEQNRALSIREGALLQTFPADYDFGEIISLESIGKHIGNAVPPKLGESIGRTIRQHIKHHE